MTPTNPKLVDATAAGANTFWQTAIAAAVFGMDDWKWIAVGVLSGLLAVGKNLLSERYPKLSRIFTAGLVEGAAFYRSKK